MATVPDFGPRFFGLDGQAHLCAIGAVPRTLPTKLILTEADPIVVDLKPLAFGDEVR